MHVDVGTGWYRDRSRSLYLYARVACETDESWKRRDPLSFWEGSVRAAIAGAMAEFMAFSALGLSEVARRGGAERQAPFELRVDHRTVPEKLFGATPSAVDDYSVTSSMRDAQATNSMTVKSGYEGHVPLGRDLIGGSYRTAVNLSLIHI